MSLDQGQTSKAFPYSSFIPFYFNGLGLSNDATTPNTLLDVAPGSCLDSTGTYQLTLSSAAKVNTAISGLGGLDTGTVAASTVYAVYLVADPIDLNPTSVMMSLAYGTKTPALPLLPFGYSAYALIGFVTIDASSHILKGYWSDNDAARRIFTYDAFQETAVTAGASTTYANVDLTKWVPLGANVYTSIYTNFAANAAADVLSLQCGNGTGDQQIITAPVVAGTAHTTTISNINAQPVSLTSVSSPVINYKVTSGSDAVAIYVAGYTFDL
jgi:hypothetical protein